MRAINKDSIPHLVSCARDLARCWLMTRWSLWLACWWGVEIDAGARFFGVPLFRRLPGSRISIGRNSTFRSAFWSNFGGLNRPCVLATLDESACIKIGTDCGFSATAIGAATSVTIGDRVIAGINTTISDTDWHPVDPASRAAGGAGASAPIVIEDDVWLAANVTVLKGVTIGAGTTVAANSIVTKSLPAGVLVGGVPARTIKSIDSKSTA